METWYNSKRSHSSLDYMSPMEYEKYHRENQSLVA
ncbi:IS3 family transposase [Desulfitibacter alkalitolerans]